MVRREEKRREEHKIFLPKLEKKIYLFVNNSIGSIFKSMFLCLDMELIFFLKE